MEIEKSSCSYRLAHKPSSKMFFSEREQQATLQRAIEALLPGRFGFTEAKELWARLHGPGWPG